MWSLALGSAHIIITDWLSGAGSISPASPIRGYVFLVVTLATSPHGSQGHPRPRQLPGLIHGRGRVRPQNLSSSERGLTTQHRLGPGGNAVQLFNLHHNGAGDDDDDDDGADGDKQVMMLQNPCGRLKQASTKKAAPPCPRMCMSL